MHWNPWVLTIALAAQIAAAQTPAASVAPTGTLRAAFLGDNPALGRVDAQSGVVTGPVADLVKVIAGRLNLPYTLIPASGARDVIARLQAGTADLGFLAYNASRAADVDFSAPWLLMPNSYIVKADSPLRTVSDADRAGVRIAAVKNDTQDVYLSANLKNTKVQTVSAMPSPEDVLRQLTGGEIDAFAANRQRLLQIAALHPVLRVMGDNYFVAGQAVALAKGDAARMAALQTMLDQILATSLVKDAIARAGLNGVDAAPPRAK